MFDRRAIALIVLAGCGAARSPSPSPPPSSTDETFECRASRTNILDAMSASRAGHPCTEATECRVVMGPGHPDPEYAQVVFAADADELDARAREHLARCGAFHHHEAIDAYREMEAACDEGHCVAHETLVHVDSSE